MPRSIPKSARSAPRPPRCSPTSSAAKLEEASPWKDDYFGHFFTIVLAETDLKGMRELVAKYGDRMQPHLVDAIKGTMTDEQITDAVVARKKSANQSWRFFRTYDLLLTPTIACIAVQARHPGAGDDRRQEGRPVPMDHLHLSVQHDRTTRRHAFRPGSPRMDYRSDCRSSAGTSTTPPCCGRRPPTRLPRRGRTSGRPCWRRWACSVLDRRLPYRWLGARDPHAHVSVSSRVFASFKSAVSKPSVNRA